MNVLIACEESQRVCAEFRRLGHRAFSCDIQECSGGHPEWHIRGDCVPLLNGNCEFKTADTHTHTQRGAWDLIIGHPPCTYLSNAGACRLLKGKRDGSWQMTNIERLKEGILGRDLFMKILSADCERIAVENPVPLGVYALPPYTQIVQPYEFGHPYTKKTCLWLKGLPKLKATNIVEPKESYVMHKIRDSKRRSKTFTGIAKAMAEQWSRYLGGEQNYDVINGYEQYKLF